MHACNVAQSLYLDGVRKGVVCAGLEHVNGPLCWIISAWQHNHVSIVSKVPPGLSVDEKQEEEEQRREILAWREQEHDMLKKARQDPRKKALKELREVQNLQHR